MTKLYGVMAGANCAVLSVLTTMYKYYYVGDKFKAYYKKSSESEYTSVASVKSENLNFRDSAWEFDVYGLEPQTTYEIYVKVDTEESNHITFTTESVIPFEYDLSPRGDISESASAKSTTLLESFAEKMSGIGYDIKSHSSTYIPKFIACDGAYLRENYGAVAVTHGLDSWIDFNNTSTPMNTIIHEYRHLMFFTGSGSKCCYASDIADGITDVNVLYKTFSFMSYNNNKSDIYTYYGENSCKETAYLYDFFILKAISNNPVTIVYGN